MLHLELEDLLTRFEGDLQIRLFLALSVMDLPAATRRRIAWRPELTQVTFRPLVKLLDVPAGSYVLRDNAELLVCGLRSYAVIRQGHVEMTSKTDPFSTINNWNNHGHRSS